MRVIAGEYRRRTLRSLPGLEIRPTSDRLRETLFNVLCAGNPAALAGSVWIDLYAGTGAVGIEALSRGASKVYFVESSKMAAEVIAANLKSLGISNGFQIMKAEAAKSLRQPEAAGCVADYIFLDPPYSMHDEYAKMLAVLAQSKLLGERCIVIAEHQKRFDPGEAHGELRRYRKLVQGDAVLSFYRREALPLPASL
ncbi:MAG TPA: 16S rRNA (guanine(966)-N(2))-methyltransferase RsmD [Terriglobales bacterium]|jgi:16S rRNA (guanine966-N2)-methyltransferase|nr:16S rRNA (guanine(966)-N(2))-methyltransferase RsmD [Terriglobales bacterium]